MIQTLLHTAWLIPLYPLAACGWILARNRRAWGAGAYVAIAGMAVACLHAVALLLGLIFAPPAQYLAQGSHEAFLTWATFAGRPLELGFVIDNLASVMCAMVTVVSLLIFIYSVGYMHGDDYYPTYFAMVSLFGFSMLTLVISNNLLQMYVGWELVGLCSYALIGHWYERRSAANAAKKAFITNRVGDFGFLIGIMVLFAYGPSLRFSEIFVALTDHQIPLAIAGVAAALLFCGAIGKSAQFPLHVWLPDAMEGPTPVSALIHAATMVAAGVYMVARVFPLFFLTQAQATLWGLSSLTVVALIGCITLLLAAVIAVTQNDIKRVLAYSTISQLGYMMLGLGMGLAGFTAGVFHLITHACFKALLFLGSGSVIHGTGVQDMWRMGGLLKKMPATAWTFLIGTAALAGIFPFAGFFSKDEILLACWGTNRAFFWLAEAGACLTALYMTRQVILVFWGAPRDPSVHAHESPPVMTIPLMVLAFFAAFLGFIGSPWIAGNLFHQFVHFVPPDLTGHAAAHAAELPGGGLVMLISTLFALGGVAFGIVLYADAPWAKLSPNDLKRGPLQYLYILSKNKFYFDELYQATGVRGTLLLAQACRLWDDYVIDAFVDLMGKATVLWSKLSGFFDDYVIDKLVDATGWASGAAGWVVNRLQTGKVQQYIIGFAAIVIVVIALLVAQTGWF